MVYYDSSLKEASSLGGSTAYNLVKTSTGLEPRPNASCQLTYDYCNIPTQIPCSSKTMHLKRLVIKNAIAGKCSLTLAPLFAAKYAAVSPAAPAPTTVTDLASARQRTTWVLAL